MFTTDTGIEPQRFKEVDWSGDKFVVFQTPDDERGIVNAHRDLSEWLRQIEAVAEREFIDVVRYVDLAKHFKPTGSSTRFDDPNSILVRFDRSDYETMRIAARLAV